MEIKTCEEYVLNELAKTQEKLAEVEEELAMTKSKYEALLKTVPMTITPGFNKSFYVDFEKKEVALEPTAQEKRIWDSIVNDLQV